MRVQASILISILGLFCISAQGQSMDGGARSVSDNQVSGKVLAHGKAAPGAIVTLQDTVSSEKTTATADKHGKYVFPKVFSGQYSLSASFKDKKSESENISIGHGDKLKKDLKIKND